MSRQLSMVWGPEAEVMQERYLAQLSYEKVVNFCSKALPCKDSRPLTGQVSSGLRKDWHSATPQTFSSYTY